MKTTVKRAILIPKYQSSYAIESKVEGIKDWHMSCNAMDKECPCEVVLAGESALILFNKEIDSNSYDMDVAYMETVLSDIKEARDLDRMEYPAMENIMTVDDKATDADNKAFIDKAAKYLDTFTLENLSIIGLDVSGVIGMEADEVVAEAPTLTPEVAETLESPAVAENEPSPEYVDPKPEPVQVSEAPGVEPVEITVITKDEALQVKEFIDGLKAMGMTVSDFLLTIKSIKAYMSTQAKVTTEEPTITEPPVEEVVEGTVVEAPVVVVEDEPATEDYSYQDAIPYPERPGHGTQAVTGGIHDIAETEETNAKAGETVTMESVDPYAELDNTLDKNKPTEIVAMESAPVDEPTAEDSTEEQVDPEELFKEEAESTIATESIDPNEPFIMTLAKSVTNDADLFELMMEHKSDIPKEILMESVNINMYEKLINNTMINTNMVDRIKRGMRINN